MRVVLIMLFGFFMLFVSSNAQCQTVSTPEVRFNAQPQHSRIVFDWGNTVSYTLKKPSNNRLQIKFDKPAKDWTSRIPIDDLITNVQAISQKPLTIEMEIQNGARTRDFVLGGRVVIDVHGKRSDPPKTETPKTEPVQKKPKESPPVKKVEKDIQTKLAPPNPDAVPVKAVEKQELPEQTFLDKVMAKQIEPHQINFSSTTAIGLAAFWLQDQLWMLTDRQDLLVKPQISGANKDSFTLQPFSVDGGTGYKTTIPTGAKIQVTGGGVLWRILISDKDNEKEPIVLKRSEDKSGQPALLWPIENPEKIVRLKHPITEREIIVVSVNAADEFARDAYDFVDFSILPSPVGLAIMPKIDDLLVKETIDGVLISRTGGLSILPEKTIKMASLSKEQAKQNKQKIDNAPRIFDFQNWSMGGEHVVPDNKTILLEGLGKKDKEQRTAGLLSLAKMYISNGFWSESLGFLNFAQTDVPDIGDHSPEFIALKGAAEALGLRSEQAFKNLSNPKLKSFLEINYWRAYALANLGDWQQAKEVLPKGSGIIGTYPPELAVRLSLTLAEVNLRGGALEEAAEFLEIAKHNKDQFKSEQAAAYAYLKGEYFRQKGKPKDTIKLWEPLVDGTDDLYRAKTGLALSRLLISRGELKPAETIDTLERLRFAWRGDELETQIAYWLGKTYFEAGEYSKGLNIMREAASVPNTDFLRPRITADMTQAFIDLFLGDELKKTSPLEAFTVYEQFIELAPADERGNQIVQRLAEHLAKSDLLSRASMLLQTQVDYRLEGTEIHRVATNLAGIYLLNNSPDEAMAALEKSLASYKASPPEYQTPHDVNRLRGDIAWRAGYWDDAAVALGDIIVDEEISLSRPLTEEHRDLLLQRAVALNLAGDRIALANTRQKYADIMAATSKGKVFEVITRPRQSAALSESINVSPEARLSLRFSQ